MKKAIFMGWADTPHLDKAAQDSLLASYSPHERDARTKGIPQLGSGAIYPVPESEITCKPFDIPTYWPRGYGMDVGWDKTAVVWGAIDRDTDVLYLYSEHYRGNAEPSIHADAIKARGDWMQGVIDPASLASSQKDGTRLFSIYQSLGLQLSPADNSRESGLLDVLQRLSTGRLKVFDTMQNWFMEYRLYRRDDKGQIVKERDHLLDSTRYLVVSGLPIMQIAPDYLERLHPGRRTRSIPHEYDPVAEFA